MNANIVAGLVALLLVLGFGVLEVVFLTQQYGQLYQTCVEVIAASDNHQLTKQKFEQFRQQWILLRETSELWLPHVDVYEINLRFAETEAYVEQGDYKQISAQMCVVKELLDYVPHLMKPSLKHIL